VSTEERVVVRLISDNAIRYADTTHDPKVDKFNLAPRLQPFIDSVRDPGLSTPYAMMVTGGWGTGKTSAMRWLSSYLARQTDRKEGDCEVDVCWFYPWKYQNEEDVWKGLIAEVILASMACQDVTTEKVVTAARQVGKFLGGSFVRLLSGLTLKAGDAKAGGEASYSLKDALSGVIEEYSKHVTPQDAYYNQFEQVLKDWIGGIYSDKRRMVVFIDDLDRCLPEVALKVLEAIKLYLNIEHLVFVAGVDKTVINAVVAKRYEDMVGEERLKEENMADKARQYLDKMFQVEVSIPPHDLQVKGFLEEQLEKSNLLSAILPKYKDIVKEAILRMGSNNPRSVIRALNSAIMGFQQSGGSELVRTQRVQHELIKAICSGLPIKQFKRCHEMLTIKADRDFFRRWHATVVKLDYRALTEQDVQSRKDQKERGKEEEQRPAKGSQSSETKTELFELYDDPAFEEYRDYLTVHALGILMIIPFVDFVSEETQAPQLPSLPEDDLLWLREILAERRGLTVAEITDQYLREIKQLNLEGCDVSDADCESLAKLKNLTKLWLNGNHITDAGCDSLAKLENLTLLSLDNNKITDAGCDSLAKLENLTLLSLDNNKITDAGCDSLAKLENLTYLSLSDSAITDAGCYSLAKLENLTYLVLNGNQITDEGCHSLAKLENLKYLLLSNNQITDAANQKLRESLPKTVIDF
jgi:hypothetical protein